MATAGQTMIGKTCLVTDGTCDLGQAVAHRLAHLGAAVVMAGRDARAGEEAMARLRAEAPGARATFLAADLAEQSAVRRLAGDFMARHPHLDVLVNDSCGFFRRRRTTSEGVEMTWAVNLLGPFLLTYLLLDFCRACAPMRIVNVVDCVHGGDFTDLGDVLQREQYRPGEAYAQARLALHMLTRELARRMVGTGVTVNAVHAGSVLPDPASQGGLARLTRRLAGLVGDTPGSVADEVVRVATAPELEGVNGRLFCRGEPVELPGPTDEVTARKLWHLSADMAGVAIMP